MLWSVSLLQFLAPSHAQSALFLHQDDFFTDDDGLSILSSSIQTSSIRSVDSLASIAEGGTLCMHLEILCNYIRDHRSLSNALILSASTYTQRTSLIIKHRFLVLHLRRGHKTDIWLRLDRLRSRDLAVLGFVLAGGEAEANDIVSCFACRVYLNLSFLSAGLFTTTSIPTGDSRKI